MKIKSIKLKDFKRFADLTIEGLPKEAKLMVMIGPNGCGKSSVFDALKLKVYLGDAMREDKILDNYYRIMEYYFKSNQHEYSRSYYKNVHRAPTDLKVGRYPSRENIVVLFDPVWNCVNVEFHGKELYRQYEWDKSMHVRSAYRNYSVPHSPIISRDDPLKEDQLVSLMENDEAVASNYWRLVSQWLERSSEVEQTGQDLATLQDEMLGELRDAIGRLFTEPPLVLKNLGHPADGDLFQFDKGTSERFSFQNLASGEKAALDLLLDAIVTKAEYDETIICIDEPEAHIHTKLQGQLLKELYNLIPDKSQLWIATHSIGMVRKAQDLWQADNNSVVFLDFGKDEFGRDRNFDEDVTITPAEPNPNFWAQTYDVALGDLAKLVSPKRIVLCEGKIEWAIKGFDATCYNQIFGSRYPDTRFVSVGGRKNVENADILLIPVIEAIAEGADILRLRDRDRATCQDRKDNAKIGIRILSRKYIEKYLLDDEVLRQLCVSLGKSDKVEEFLAAKDKVI